MRELSAGTIAWDAHVWRYFDLRRFFELLDTSTLYFASANEFEDPFEGAVYVERANHVRDATLHRIGMVDRSFSELKRLTKINCWHAAHYESAAMWELYAARNKGIALRTTPKRMRAAFTPFRLSPEYGTEDLWAGPVNYVDLTETPCDDPPMLGRFFRKHRAFESEREFRLAISLRMAEESGVRVPDRGISVHVDLHLLVDQIFLGASISPVQQEKLFQRLERTGLGDRAEWSTLLGRPRYFVTPPPAPHAQDRTG